MFGQNTLTRSAEIAQGIELIFKSPRLTIELVPSTCWFSNLRDHLAQEQWDVVRKAVYRAYQYRCGICGGQGREHPVECHEVWHYDDRKMIQKVAGLIALCPACHRVKHIGLADAKGQMAEAVMHLANVNKWDDNSALAYTYLVFELWQERSRCDWKLDLTWLKDEFGMKLKSKRGQEKQEGTIGEMILEDREGFDSMMQNLGFEFRETGTQGIREIVRKG